MIHTHLVSVFFPRLLLMSPAGEVLLATFFFFSPTATILYANPWIRRTTAQPHFSKLKGV